MSTVCWVLLGIIGVSLTLYFVFTFAKKIELIQKITSSILFPAIGSLYIILLFNYIPDSLHIIKISILSFFFLSISQILSNFFNTKVTKVLEPLTFIISVALLALLYKSVFIIYRVATWINVVAACSYVIVFFLFFIIFIKKSSVRLYVYGIITLLVTAFVHYCTLLTLCFSPTTFSIIRFLGLTSLLAYVIFELLNHSVINLKLKKLIGLMILLASTVLISLSNLMILYY